MQADRSNPTPQHSQNESESCRQPLELSGITRVYGRARDKAKSKEIGPVSLTIERGSFVALLGPNGSGKSTLLRILSLSDTPNSGRIRCAGIDPHESRASHRAYRSALGVAFQSPGLDRLLTVRENLVLAGAISELKPEAARDRITLLSTRLGIADRLDDRVSTLSGGLIRRVDLCRAMLARPSLLLLDEPTAGLDLLAREEFMRLLAREMDSIDPRPTTIMATHMMDEAVGADRVVMMHRGKVVADGSPEELRDRVAKRRLRIWIRSESDSTLAARCLAAAPQQLIQREAGATTTRDICIGLHEECAWLAGVISSLSESGLSFELSAPTLGDAYVLATGESLTQVSDTSPDLGPEASS
ncbi:MAG: ABC transporter ATP-binding protein [Phycisphaeraceae bacterium]|nr:ABC transporter ATP-binding protein [Phycisphaeraceae bacterium]MBX3366824.1 ABC transporter ATP-binding protein [Phycisphaeraceae bacterium]